jgi:hypothetical protein
MVSNKTIAHNILVCGIPGSAKTTYCAWLEREKGFMHLDLDELEKGNGTDKKLALLDCLRHSAERFLTVIARIEQPIVIDWGFPPHLLGMVTCLNANGFAVWWFDGDRHAARESFIRRHKDGPTLEDFERQIKLIDENWYQIGEVVGDHLVSSVSAGPAYRSPEDIHERIFKSRRP